MQLNPAAPGNAWTGGFVVERTQSYAKSSTGDIATGATQCSVEINGAENRVVFTLQLELIPGSSLYSATLNASRKSGQLDTLAVQHSKYSFNITVNERKYEGQYTIFFCQRNAGSSGMPKVSMVLDMVEYNTGPDYLSAGDAPLPAVLGALALAYFVMSCTWAYAVIAHRYAAAAAVAAVVGTNGSRYMTRMRRWTHAAPHGYAEQSP